MRKEEIVELAGPPVFSIGDKVRSKKMVRNDGTYPGIDIGKTLIEEGDVGYIQNVGEFLQQFWIYSVDFYEKGQLVGMRAKELELIQANSDFEDDED